MIGEVGSFHVLPPNSGPPQWMLPFLKPAFDVVSVRQPHFFFFFFVVTHTNVFLFSPALGTDRPHIGDTKDTCTAVTAHSGNNTPSPHPAVRRAHCLVAHTHDQFVSVLRGPPHCSTAAGWVQHTAGRGPVRPLPADTAQHSTRRHDTTHTPHDNTPQCTQHNTHNTAQHCEHGTVQQCTYSDVAPPALVAGG